MKNNMKTWLLVLVVLAIPLMTYASVAPPPPEAIRDNYILFSWILGICFLVISGFILRMLNQQDKRNEAADANNQKQWQAISKNAIDIAHQQGICESKNHGGRRAYDPEDRFTGEIRR
jgi:hypothetical protein